MQAVLLCLVVLAGWIAATWVVLRAVPGATTLVLGGEERRKHALDGLRGILALSVMIHHPTMGYLSSRPGRLQHIGGGAFVNQLGSLPVALFFMISAYLFGSKLLRARGHLDVARFAASRVRRIVPLYLFAVALVVVMALANQHFQLVVAPGKLVREVGRHLLFDFVPRYDINGFPALALLGMVWTLRLEWLLYLVLPVMALAYRRTGSAAALYAPLLLLVMAVGPLCWLFVAGLAVAQLAGFDSPRARAAWQAAGLVGLIVLLCFFSSSSGALQALILVPLLVAVVQQHRMFACLGGSAFRFLGEISFSVYLLHGTAIYVFLVLTGIRLEDLTFWQFAGAAWAAGMTAILASVVTFVVVERPFMLGPEARGRQRHTLAKKAGA